jgi:hypothetical protein
VKDKDLYWSRLMCGKYWTVVVKLESYALPI